jgi:hypothetical protein
MATAKMRKYEYLERTIVPYPKFSRRLSSDDRYTRALRVGQAQCFDPEDLFRSFRAERDEQNLIVIMFDDLIERGAEFLKPQIIQRALEDRILEALTEGFTGLGHLPQALRVADVIADQITGAGHGQRVVKA